MKPDSGGEPGNDTGRDVFRFRSQWDLPVARDSVWQVFESLVDQPDPFVWWPDVSVLSRTAQDVHVEARSRLGYRLRFRLHDLWSEPPTRIGFACDGDLIGCAVVDLTERGPHHSTVVVHWTAETTRPWMRRTMPVLRPVFVAGHHGVMRRAHAALRQWLAV